MIMKRIENMLFDGVASTKKWLLYPDMNKPGFGIEFKH